MMCMLSIVIVFSVVGDRRIAGVCRSRLKSAKTASRSGHKSNQVNDSKAVMEFDGRYSDSSLRNVIKKRISALQSSVSSRSGAMQESQKRSKKIDKNQWLDLTR